MSLETNAAPKLKAYSYLRFSTPEQQKGDSFRRQSQMASDYAARKGLELDDTLRLHDLGISGFRGDNLATGMLGYFKEAVVSGEVPKGSYLLVESLDRISRQNARRAQRVLEDIADQGIIVVTLIDEREYSRESMERDPIELVMSILQFMRANEESATKSRRLKEAWAAKRSRLGSEALTSRVPAWVGLDRSTGRLVIIPERKAVVEHIFRETLAGIGQHQIAATLNRDGVEPWGRGAYWHRSYVAKILESEAVIGTFTPHTLDYVAGKRSRTPQERVEGYFPAAISVEMWNDVRAFKDGKHSRTRAAAAHPPMSALGLKVGLVAGIGASR
jgi:DNA invertase Pin-like site-specific DNA recombinase